MTYRLPTEQEWEKAAAWDPVEQHFYLYGVHRDTIGCSWCNYNNCGVGTTTEVGHYNGSNGTEDAKSYYGCYDMSGNVREWTYSDGTVAAWRGGHFTADSAGVMTTYRYSSDKNTRSDVTGFRCAMVVDE